MSPIPNTACSGVMPDCRATTQNKLADDESICDLHRQFLLHLTQVDWGSTLMMNLIMRKRAPRPSDLPMKTVNGLFRSPQHGQTAESMQKIGLRRKGTKTDVMRRVFIVLIERSCEFQERRLDFGFFRRPGALSDFCSLARQQLESRLLDESARID